METVAELRLHGQTQVAPGESMFARVVLPETALLLPGDRFIIRQFSPVVTIGGGIVLDASPTKRAAGLAEFLNLLVTGRLEQILEARIARQGSSGLEMKTLVAETGFSSETIHNLLAKMVQEGNVVRIAESFVHSGSLEALKLALFQRVEQFHQQNPLAPGVGREQLRDQRNVSAEIFDAVLIMLVRNQKIEVTGDLVRLAGRRVVMKEEEAESKKKIEDAFAMAGLKVPALHEVLASLKVDKLRAQQIVTLLLRDRVLVKVSEGLVFHRSALEGLRRQMAAQKAKSSKIDVGGFKEMTGVSRKYAIPLLEYLDRERVTKRVGDAREIL
jgi:selenocysteine-specific elongation factor